MAIIKQASASETARSAIVLDLGDVRRQGELMVEQARRQAESILIQARSERERILAGAAEQGRTAGHAQGLEEGRRAGAEQGRGAALAQAESSLGALQNGWTQALSEFQVRRERMLAEARRDVLRLAVLIGEKIVKRTIALDETVVAEQLAAVLSLIVRPTEVVVAINPADRALAQDALPALMSGFQAARHVEFVDDASLERGSCVARMRGCSDAEADSGPGGEIDASIETQLKRIVEVLLPGAPRRAPTADTGQPSSPPSREPAP